jgi:hypothetical protein
MSPEEVAEELELLKLKNATKIALHRAFKTFAPKSMLFNRMLRLLEHKYPDREDVYFLDAVSQNSFGSRDFIWMRCNNKLLLQDLYDQISAAGAEMQHGLPGRPNKI